MSVDNFEINLQSFRSNSSWNCDVSQHLKISQINNKTMISQINSSVAFPHPFTARNSGDSARVIGNYPIRNIVVTAGVSWNSRTMEIGVRDNCTKSQLHDLEVWLLKTFPTHNQFDDFLIYNIPPEEYTMEIQSIDI